MSRLKLLQVSDCHLAADAAALYRGVSADANLARLTPAVAAWRPAWLVLTGDLAEDGSAAAYQRIADWSVRFGCRVAWLPGNHDDPAVMASIFTAAGFEAGPLLDAGDWQLALLDSSWPDDPAGEVDETRLAALDAIDPRRPLGLFVHHQPVPVRAAWIDKVGMRRPERLWSRLSRLRQLNFVAFGHVHQRFRGRQQGVECLACPSSAANSLPATTRFTAGETTPLARWFVLDSDRFRSGYLAA